MDWLASLRKRLHSAGATDAAAAVRITVAAVRGSAPREPGACMLVGNDWEDGTIGGGHLELMATGIARQMLGETGDAYGRLDRFPLGAALGQCCGGIVELWFERFTSADMPLVEDALTLCQHRIPVVLATSISLASPLRHRLIRAESISDAQTAEATAAMLLQDAPDAPRAILKRGAGDAGSTDVLYERIDRQATPLWLFGAGHVGKALVKIFADLPFDLIWVDSREAMFPAQVPDNVRIAQYDVPADAVIDAQPGSMFLVLTHNHDLDFDICRAILEREDFAWAGLIGSKTKAARFVQRLRQRGFSGDSIARLTCPIGVGGIASKLPAAIAVAVAAQVLQAVEMLHAVRTQPEILTQAQS
jgi:xanthine dehydrogenase accessory factor